MGLGSVVVVGCVRSGVSLCCVGVGVVSVLELVSVLLPRKGRLAVCRCCLFVVVESSRLSVGTVLGVGCGVVDFETVFKYCWCGACGFVLGDDGGWGFVG